MSFKTQKIKPMTLEELTLSIDRLTRFKFPDDKFNRVFREILAKYQIEPRVSFKEYECLKEEDICRMVEAVFSQSLLELGGEAACECELYRVVAKYEEKIFKLTPQTRKLLNAQIPYEAIFKLNQKKDLCRNLSFWREFWASRNTVSAQDIRKKFSTKFPIEKVVLAEGITEEILLPKFANILNFDFDKSGVALIPAGGKNQVAKDYLKWHELLNIPIVVLLDADAKPVAQTISSMLRKTDRLILIEKGEFEDVLPLELIKAAINNRFLNFYSVEDKDFSPELSMVKNLEEIYRINGLGEFKKAEFAHNVAEVLVQHKETFISEEIRSIIEQINKT